MNAALQNRISPPVQAGAKNFGEVSTIEKPKAIDSNAPTKTDFRDLIGNSNVEAKKDREAKKNGDLSGAKTEAEFLEKLQKRDEPLRVPKNNLDKDDFLKLFVTQLQHQDPLNPDDSAEMASKLAHFNSLEQMLNVNKTLDKLVVAQNTGRQLQMIDYVGKEITVNGGRTRLKGGKPSESIFDLPTPSSETQLQVRDAAGVIVTEKALGSLPAGEQKFAWDGKGSDGKPLPDGVYTYNLTAKSIDRQDIPVSLHSRVKITGVDVQDTAGSVFTDLGKVKLEDIKAVGDQGFSVGIPAAVTPAANAVKAGATAATGSQPIMNGPVPPGTPSPEELQQLLQASLGQQPQKGATSDKGSGMMPNNTNEQTTQPEQATNAEAKVTQPAADNAPPQPRSM